MGSNDASVIVALAHAGRCEDDRVGGKARNLGRLIEAGYRVPAGFVVDARAYESFVESAGLAALIQMELGRKPMATMRWEEIWDAALRIRAAFLAAPIPHAIAKAIGDAHAALASGSVVVRSSAPGEDSATRSYAGLHESLVGVEGGEAVLDAVRIVWASLWSDAALLYRKELQLDVTHSRMAVVVQEFIRTSVSGVGFGVDPRQPNADREIVEAVPGRCETLVSGAVDPDRWILKSSSGELVEWKPGVRGDTKTEPILGRDDLAILHRTLRSVESLLGQPPDVEWTGRSSDLTLLQARPVTTATEDDQERAWYLTLRLGRERLRDLCARVTDELIPELETEALRFAREDLADLSDADVADALEARLHSYERWKETYKQDFIPFAHGVRHFGTYYNDAVRPADPYEFVCLLENQPMLASRRNAALAQLASVVASDARLAAALHDVCDSGTAACRAAWDEVAGRLRTTPAWNRFCTEFEAFLEEFMDICFDDEALGERPDLSLAIVLQLAHDGGSRTPRHHDPAAVEQRLLDAVGTDRHAEALELLQIARLSWRLRDDDNILMGRLENQLHRVLARASEILRRQGRLDASTPVPSRMAPTILEALRDPSGSALQLPGSSTPERPRVPPQSDQALRQMIGQPAARGLATGTVRIVREADDLRRFRRGDVMVCDSIQPTMTHLVPLASGIVERRGGMLIHGAIIARELGIPCVNGVAGASEALRDGDIVTVDGNLGIVTVGPPDFDLERQSREVRQVDPRR